MSGLLLGVLSVVSYNVLARWLDEDVTARLTELTDGLHGYLRFEGDVPTVEYNANDADQASFVREATRYLPDLRRRFRPTCWSSRRTSRRSVSR